MNPAEWSDQYNVKNRGGTYFFDAQGLTYGPPAVSGSAATSAAMIVYRPTDPKLGGTAVANWIVEFEMVTLRQLRQNAAPNQWEVGGLATNYQYNPDLTKIMNWIVPKPRSLQISTASKELQETWLHEPMVGTAIGQIRQYKAEKVGQRMRIWFDGVLVADYTASGGSCQAVGDDGMTPETRPCWFYSDPGAIALYNEDALVKVNNFRLTRL